jgi:hypothetical protein
MIDDAALWLGIVVSHQDRSDAFSSISCSARIDGKRGRGQEDDSVRPAAAAATVVAGGGRSNGRALIALPGAGARRRQAAVRDDAQCCLLELALRQALDRLPSAIRRSDRRQGQLRDAVPSDLQSAHRCRAVDRRLVLRRSHCGFWRRAWRHPSPSRSRSFSPTASLD